MPSTTSKGHVHAVVTLDLGAGSRYRGLATVALTMPELYNASVWFEHAQSKILEDMEDGVYPDGVEDEETAHYHAVALKSFAGFLALVRESGGTADPRISEIVERMWNYLALSLDPSGVSPLNGDADTDNNTEGVLEAATTFNRSDWLYIASHGHDGVSPKSNFSAMFPWAGQLVSRSGWEVDAQWSWFDVGPFGSSGHGHQCRTHLSVRLGSSHLLVDSGRFSYNGDLAVCVPFHPRRSGWIHVFRSHSFSSGILVGIGAGTCATTAMYPAVTMYSCSLAKIRLKPLRKRCRH